MSCPAMKKKILMSFVVEDMTGGTVNISGDTGKISGDIMTKIGTDELQNNLFFELKTTDLNGEENEYQLQLTVTKLQKRQIISLQFIGKKIRS